MFSAIGKDAKAQIKGGRKFPKIHGMVYFKQTKQGVLVSVKVYDLPSSKNKCQNGIFGFHIHKGTSCKQDKEDDFKETLTHYNPKNCKHPNHAGDLPSLFENSGYAYMEILTNRFKVSDILGKTVVIHDSPDDFKTDPSGNSGQKIACGVIKKT